MTKRIERIVYDDLTASLPLLPPDDENRYERCDLDTFSVPPEHAHNVALQEAIYAAIGDRAAAYVDKLGTLSCNDVGFMPILYDRNGGSIWTSFGKWHVHMGGILNTVKATARHRGVRLPRNKDRATLVVNNLPAAFAWRNGEDLLVVYGPYPLLVSGLATDDMKAYNRRISDTLDRWAEIERLRAAAGR